MQIKKSFILAETLRIVEEDVWFFNVFYFNGFHFHLSSFPLFPQASQRYNVSKSSLNVDLKMLCLGLECLPRLHEGDESTVVQSTKVLHC